MPYASCWVHRVLSTIKYQRKNMNIKSYERITERITDLLSQGTVPWHKPWQVKTGLPRNLGSVKKGEKACPVVFWKQMEVTDKESGELEKIPLLRLYFVFNVAQCEGLRNMPAEDNSSFVATEAAEIVAKMPQPPKIKHGMSHAYYTPVNDIVGMPEPKRFDTEDAYHATLFHELMHSTGHEKRLN